MSNTTILIASVVIVSFIAVLSSAAVFARFAYICIREMPEATRLKLIKRYQGQSLHFFFTK